MTVGCKKWKPDGEKKHNLFIGHGAEMKEKDQVKKASRLQAWVPTRTVLPLTEIRVKPTSLEQIINLLWGKKEEKEKKNILGWVP